MKCFSLTLMFLALPVAAHADDAMRWQHVNHAGIEADLPDFLLSGLSHALIVDSEDRGTAFEPQDYPISVRLYRTPKQRAVRHLEATFGREGTVTYRIDNSSVGILSGIQDGNVFYGICRAGRESLRCIGIRYAAAQKDVYDPIAARISKSFRE